MIGNKFGQAQMQFLNPAFSGTFGKMEGYSPNQGATEPQLPQWTNYASSMFGNPFGTVMSGTQSGTLQPYVNRMTQNASNALYGGLLNYQPQSLIAGDAGGTPVNSTAPQWNLPSMLGGLNFGNRSWMNQGG